MEIFFWKLLACLLSYVLLSSLVSALDDQAILQCHQLHNANADSNSVFVNADCQLNCYIGGKLFPHQLNEGIRCPLSSDDFFICKSGACVERIFYGRINFEIHFATLSAKVNPYATACLVNSTQAIHLPMRERTSCVECLTGIVSNTDKPVWNVVCSKVNQQIFSSQSTLVLEVWNHRAQLDNQFVGGAVQVIPQLSDHKFDDRELILTLAGGTLTGTIKTHFTWSPVVSP